MTARRVLPALLLLFVGSGCAALIYEIVWFQLLQLVIGSSAVSMGVLLGTFMGGMCLGSLFLPRLISSREHPCACTRISSWRSEWRDPASLRDAAAGRPVFPLGRRRRERHPVTGGRGGDLPAAADARHGRHAAGDLALGGIDARGVSWLGFFYGGNIAGGVIGCLLAGFYLLRVHDVAFATFIALSLNVIVAVLAILIAKTGAARRRRQPAPLERASGAWAVYVAIGFRA
jgi:spermidine synthase